MTTINKNEMHITSFPREVDRDLAIALGEMVVAFGRLEDMFKLVIKRAESPQRTLAQVIQLFSGVKGSLDKLVKYCETNFSNLELSECYEEAKSLNTERQNYIHATFGLIQEDQYVRFRSLVAHTDLAQDIQSIKGVTERVNALISKLDQKTGAPLASAVQNESIITAVSAVCTNTRG